MAQAPIQRPNLAYTKYPNAIQRAAITESGSTAFKAGQFVTAAGTKMANTGVAAYGLSEDDAHGSTAETYTSPFGTAHNLVDIGSGNTFWVNVCDSSHVVGTGSVTAGSVAVGTQYGMIFLTSTGYTDVQCLNYSDTSTKFFQVEGFHPDDAAGDLNGRVLVSIIPTCVQ